MSYEIPSFKLGVYPANVDLSSTQFLGVTVGAATNTNGAGFGGAALVLPAQGDIIIGVVQNKPGIGEAGELIEAGVTKATAGEAFSIGAKLMVGADGKFYIATSAKFAVAIAVEDSSGANSVCAILLKDMGLMA